MEDNTQCVQETPCQPFPSVKLWCLTYKVSTEPNYEGMAVVSAVDVHQAEQIFLSDCMHNGTPDLIKIGRIDQIPFPIVPKLIMENYVEIVKYNE